MPYNSIAVANAIIDIARSRGAEIDPMKLQKLAYFAHGWSLYVYNLPLMDEAVQAWAFGPVFPNIYHHFKQFGPNPIDAQTGEQITDPETWALLNKIWDVYGNYTGIQLANMTHDPNGPWDKARKQNPGRKWVAIPDDEIKAYFARLANPRET